MWRRGRCENTLLTRHVLSAFFPNKQMYRSRVSQIDMGSFIVVTFPDCLFSSQFSLLDGSFPVSANNFPDLMLREFGG